ncbi:MAG: hypothetical protein WD737_02115 [Gemmatimonadota bacterium]
MGDPWSAQREPGNSQSARPAISKSTSFASAGLIISPPGTSTIVSVVLALAGCALVPLWWHGVRRESFAIHREAPAAAD